MPIFNCKIYFENTCEILKNVNTDIFFGQKFSPHSAQFGDLF